MNEQVRATVQQHIRSVTPDELQAVCDFEPGNSEVDLSACRESYKKLRGLQREAAPSRRL